MSEVLRVVLRIVGVPLPAVAFLGVVELFALPKDQFGTFLLAVLLSLAGCATWGALDARRTTWARVLLRWAVVVVVLGVGLGVGSTLLDPGSPPSDRVGEAVGSSLFYGVPLLLAAGLGVAIGGSERRLDARD